MLDNNRGRSRSSTFSFGPQPRFVSDIGRGSNRNFIDTTRRSSRDEAFLSEYRRHLDALYRRQQQQGNRGRPLSTPHSPFLANPQFYLSPQVINSHPHPPSDATSGTRPNSWHFERNPMRPPPPSSSSSSSPRPRPPPPFIHEDYVEFSPRQQPFFNLGNNNNYNSISNGGGRPGPVLPAPDVNRMYRIIRLLSYNDAQLPERNILRKLLVMFLETAFETVPRVEVASPTKQYIKVTNGVRRTNEFLHVDVWYEAELNQGGNRSRLIKGLKDKFNNICRREVKNGFGIIANERYMEVLCFGPDGRLFDVLFMHYTDQVGLVNYFISLSHWASRLRA